MPIRGSSFAPVAPNFGKGSRFASHRWTTSTDATSVHLTDGETMPYDVLVIATGGVLLPEETEGLTGPGGQEKIFTFYTLEGATLRRDALRAFDRGRLVVNMVDLPIKCPVAPLEFCFLTDWYLTRRAGFGPAMRRMKGCSSMPEVLAASKPRG